MEEKGVAPLLPEESLRSTKKVRIRGEGDDGGGNGELAGKEVVMGDVGVTGEVSYRSKLLSMDQSGQAERALDEVVVTEGDYLVSKEGDMPVIEFSKEVREVLVKGMEKTLIIKLLGRSVIYRDLLARTQALWRLRGTYQLVDMEGGFYFASFDLEEDYTKVLTGGPWMLFGAYLTVQPWTIDFDPRSTKVSNVVVWVRIPGLSFQYYHKSTLRAIGKLLGEVVKLDYSTETRGRGRYARIAVLADLQNPLIPWIKVDGRTYGVEYECLPLICFECGRYGHTKERCKEVATSRAEEIERTLRPPVQPTGPAAGDASGSGTSQYGSWMQVRYPKKGNKQYLGNKAKFKDVPDSRGSRYNILFDCNDLEAEIMQPIEATREDINVKMGENGMQNGGVGQKVGPKDKQKMGIGNRVVHGKPMVAQEYRPKSLIGGQSVMTPKGNDPPPSKPVIVMEPQTKVCSGELASSVKSGGEINGQTEEGCLGDAGKKLGYRESTTKEDPVAFVQMESTLDMSKHTVVELQRSRNTLEEVRPQCLDTNMDMGLVDGVHGKQGMGKENAGKQFREQMQGQHGIKLHSPILHKMKSPCGANQVRWATVFGIACWKLWEARNLAVFQNKNSQSVFLVKEVVRYAGFYEDARSRTTVARGGNRCADWLATFALDMGIGLHILQEPPDGIKECLQEDVVGMGWLRRCCSSSGLG
ncbi:hypothetical protein K1719_046567 [Acacia pycnantha]|nr:hypothetical protein K1719_046567 [Acacia pycnantha]